MRLICLDGLSSWLHPYLSDKAQQAYASLSAEDAAQYENVKDAVFHRYNIKEETYRQRFRSRRKGTGETYQEQVSRLLDVAKKWLKECTTVDELLDDIIKEQLVDNLLSLQDLGQRTSQAKRPESGLTATYKLEDMNEEELDRENTEKDHIRTENTSIIGAKGWRGRKESYRKLRIPEKAGSERRKRT